MPDITITREPGSPGQVNGKSWDRLTDAEKRAGFEAALDRGDVFFDEMERLRAELVRAQAQVSAGYSYRWNGDRTRREDHA